MIRKTALRGAAVAALLVLTSPAALAAEETSPESVVVAEVNGEQITKADVIAMKESMSRQIPQIRNMPLEALFGGLLERAIDQKLISAKAADAGLEDDPAVQEQIAAVKAEILRREWLTRQVDARIDEDRLKEAYDKFLAENPAEEEVRARHILVEDEATAKEIIKELEGGADFAELAKEKSTGPSGARGGDLGYFKKGAMVPAFSDAAFALDAGDITKDPVQTQFGWHVIKLEDRRTAEPPTFEEQKEELRAQLTQQVVEEVLTSLREDADVKTYSIEGKAAD